VIGAAVIEGRRTYGTANPMARLKGGRHPLGVHRIGRFANSARCAAARKQGVLLSLTQPRLPGIRRPYAHAVVATAQFALSGEQLDLLARHRLVRPLLRSMVMAELSAGIEIAEEQRRQAMDAFMGEQQISTQEGLDAFLRMSLLRQDELEEQLLQPLRLKRYIDLHHLPKAEARFLQRKNQLDRVVYSLLRLEDAGLARELYLQINEGEADFSELAARYAEGPERNTRGIVGPVPLMQAHPLLAERLRAATPGALMEPFLIERWWLVVRLETFSPACLDEGTAAQMAQELFEETLEEQVKSRISQLIPLRFPQP